MRIAILGAGPAGLTLASFFTKSNIPFTAFDLRPRPSPSDINTPSGSLDLHAEDGLLAIESLGLSERFKELTGECTENQKLADKHGVVHYEDFDDGSRRRPEIARNALSHLLLSSVAPETIRWEHKVSGVQQALDGKRWRLHFARAAHNDENEDFDLVVGADGAWSKVRQQLTEIKPVFAGRNWITLTIPHLETTFPHLAEMVGTGSYIAAEEGKGVVVQRGSLQSARVYLVFKSPPSSKEPENFLKDSGLDSLAPAELKARLLSDGDLYESWGDNVKELISVGCDAEAESGSEISVRPFYELPLGHHSWTHRRGLTLIGDAAHLTLPSGEGVNAAMLDALQLSQAIAKSNSLDEVDEAVKDYETGMFPRAQALMEDALQINELIYSKDAPKTLVDFMKSHGAEGLES